MTVAPLAPPRVRDPFAAGPAAPVPRRPRLLAYAGRWGRARRWLPDGALRVLDIGCSFGYGAAALAVHGPAGRVVVGVERDRSHLERGRRRFPWLTLLEGDATALPVPDRCADAVLLLDVVEHLAEPERAFDEAARALRPGGVLVVSVPHRGPLRHLDALNVYAAIRRRRPSWPPLEAPAESGSGAHLHFSPRELADRLGPAFAVDRMARTGLGLAELVHLMLLAIKVPLRMPALCRALMPLHLLVYLAEDLVPAGPLGYHLTVRATKGGPA